MNANDNRLEDLKYEKDLKSKEIADMLKVNESTYSEWEHNRIPIPTKRLIEISLNSPLGKALFKAKIGTSTSYFVGNSEIFITILEKLNN